MESLLISFAEASLDSSIQPTHVSETVQPALVAGAAPAAQPPQPPATSSSAASTIAVPQQGYASTTARAAELNSAPSNQRQQLQQLLEQEEDIAAEARAQLLLQQQTRLQLSSSRIRESDSEYGNDGAASTEGRGAAAAAAVADEDLSHRLSYPAALESTRKRSGSITDALYKEAERMRRRQEEAREQLAREARENASPQLNRWVQWGRGQGWGQRAGLGRRHSCPASSMSITCVNMQVISACQPLSHCYCCLSSPSLLPLSLPPSLSLSSLLLPFSLQALSPHCRGHG